MNQCNILPCKVSVKEATSISSSVKFVHGTNVIMA